MSKITVNTKKFKEELAFVNTCVSKKEDESWAYVLFEVSDGKLRLTTTDCVGTASSVIDLEEKQDECFTFAILGLKLAEKLKLTSEPNLVFSLTKERINLYDGTARYAHGVDDTAVNAIKPTLSFGSEGSPVSMRSDTLNRALKVAGIFSADKEKSQYNLKGATILAAPDALISCCSDGQRAVDLTQHENFPQRNQKIFVGKDYLNLLVAISDYSDNQEIIMINSENSIQFHCGKRLAIIRVAAANTPLISPAITARIAEADVKFNVDAEQFLVKMTKLYNATGGKYKAAKLSAKNKEITITASGLFTDDFQDVVPTDYEGEFEFNVNAEFIIEYLKLVTGNVELSYLIKNEKRAGGLILTHPSGLRCMLALMV